jgi:hypothetical protein
MSGEESNRGLIVALATALGGALLVIGFLLGRQSSPRAPAAVPGPETAASPRIAPAAQTPAQPRPSRWAAEPTADPSQYRYDEYEPPARPRFEKRPNGTIVISNPRVDAPPAQPSYDQRSSTPESDADDSGGAVNAYFRRVQLIHSAAGAGDPNSFAMGMIKAGLGGSTAGFDRLVADSERMELQLKSIAPPPECARFHQASLDSLVEGRALLERMKTAIVSRNITKLNEIAQDAAELQSKADELAEMEKQIRASVGAP